MSQKNVKNAIQSKSEIDPLIKVRFNRLNWSYIVSSFLLLILPIFNFPFTSTPGEPYEFRFFLDFELIARIDIHRNVIEFILMVPLYYILGILPGIFGLLLLVYSLISGGPTWLYINSENLHLVETKFFVPTRSNVSLKGLQMVRLGNRRLNLALWLFFLFFSFMAIYLFMYAFDSLKNNGSLYYFQIYQDIWNGNQIIGQINLGFQLLFTALIFFLGPLLMVFFSKRECHIETSDYRLLLPYSSMKISILDETDTWKNVPLALLMVRLNKTHKELPALLSDERGESKSSDSILNPTQKSYPEKYFPKKKILLYTLSLTLLLLYQFLPHLYLANFTIPFTDIGLLVILYCFLTTLNTEWFCKQKIWQADNKSMIIRSNPLSGTNGWLYQNPDEVKEIYSPRSPSLTEYFIGPIFLWEIFVIWGILVKYNSYFFVDTISILHCFTTVLLFITILIFYLLPRKILSFSFSSHRASPNYSETSAEQFPIFWPSPDHISFKNLRSIGSNFLKGYKNSKLGQSYINLLPFFCIPIILFIFWLLNILWIHILI